MYHTFKLRAFETGQSISVLMNDAMQAQPSEDAADRATTATSTLYSRNRKNRYRYENQQPQEYLRLTAEPTAPKLLTSLLYLGG